MEANNSKVCRENRADVLKQMEEFTAKIKAEGRIMSEEERTQFDELDKSQEGLLAQAESFERLERVDQLTSQTLPEIRASLLDSSYKASNRWERQIEERNDAIAGWLYHGSKKDKPQYWRAAERLGINVESPDMRFDWLPQTLYPQRAVNVIGTPNLGGNTVAVDTSLMSQIDISLKQFGGILNVANVVRTPTGANLPWPTTDDTVNPGQIDAEAAPIGDQAVAFGQNVMSSYRIDSKGFVKVSWELENDSAVDLASLLGELLGIRVARAANTYWATGTGGGTQPKGVLTGLFVGCTTAGPTAITYADIQTWYHSLDPAYRNMPGTCFMFHDSVYQILGNLVDTAGRPLLMSSLSGVSDSIPERLKGKPIVLNNSFPAFAANTAVGAYGDFKKFYIRLVTGDSPESGMHMVRLVERFADAGQTAYLAWFRTDSLLSDAGTHPLTALKVHV